MGVWRYFVCGVAVAGIAGACFGVVGFEFVGFVWLEFGFAVAWRDVALLFAIGFWVCCFRLLCWRFCVCWMV